ncbi:MAG: PQQ-dependent sugar dehydrogenase [Verrucomicrobiota bacterium]
MPPRFFSSLALISALLATSVPAQITDPLPSMLPSGTSIVLEPWLTFPKTETSDAQIRLNHLKPCPDGTRLFANDLNGRFWTIPNKNAAAVAAVSTATSAGVFLNIADFYPYFIKSSGLGTGFTSFAFHPEFSTPGAPGYGRFYTAHSESNEGGAVDCSGPLSAATSQVGTIVEWTMTNPADVTVTEANTTRRTILRIGYPFNYHDTQEISFNPTALPGDEDYGCLFICVGDGGSIELATPIPGNLGRIDSPLGAIHRIVPILASATVNGLTTSDFTLSANGSYHIPSGTANANPNIGLADPTPDDGFPVIREMYANGFRNPHRISWDSGGTHKMFCGNIGENLLEEVELIKKGRNYGWPHREGSFRFVANTTSKSGKLYALDPSPEETGPYTFPVAQYDHTNDKAVVGGFVYRGAAIPELQGKYLCGDIFTGNMWIADESAMVLQSSTATAAAPAALRSLAIKLGTTPTTFLGIIGSSRADLRFGIDHDGEPYAMSKYNGTVYRIKRDTSTGGGFETGTTATWAPAATFENGVLSGIASTRGTGAAAATYSSTQIVSDPVEGPSNRVIRIQAPGSTGSYNVSLPVTEIPDGSYGTLFFRFYTPDQNQDVNFGLTHLASPVNFDSLRVQMRSTANSGALEVRNGAAIQVGDTISTGTWYSVWATINNATGTAADTWNLYIKGGSRPSPTLMKTNIAFRTGVADSLKRFFIWSAASSASPLYIDDVHVDVGHFNITDPTESAWQTVDQFEGATPLAGWSIPSAAAQSTTLVSEAGGNHFLRRAASSSSAANTKAVAAKKLPFVTQTGQLQTTFFRFKLEGRNLNHSFGISALNPADAAAYTVDELETHLRISSIDVPAGVDLFDGSGGAESFVPAAIGGTPIPGLSPDIWYKVWLVANNGGWASGGQTWKTYLQGGPYQEPTDVSGTVHFDKGSEQTITHFLSIASTDANGNFANDAVCIDDIFAYPGVSLEDPVAAKMIPATFTRSGNQVTLGYQATLNRAIQPFRSTDLQNWEPAAAAIEGDGNLWQLTEAIVPPRRFFKALEHSRRAFHPAIWSTTFAEGTTPAGVTLIRPTTSVWTPSAGKLTLTLTSEQAYPVIAGMTPRPGSYALVPGNWKNADIRMSARTLRTTATAIRDVVIPFGYIDETHFYYAHFSATSDGTAHTVIGKVSGNNTRTFINTPVTVSPAPFTSLATTGFRVTHSSSGAIAIYCGNLTTPFMTASDTSYPAGRVGFGAFDDPAEFTSFSVSGDQQ